MLSCDIMLISRIKRGILHTHRRAFLFGITSTFRAREWRDRLHQSVAHHMDLDGSIYDHKRMATRTIAYDTMDRRVFVQTPTYIPTALPMFARHHQMTHATIVQAELERCYRGTVGFGCLTPTDRLEEERTGKHVSSVMGWHVIPCGVV